MSTRPFGDRPPRRPVAGSVLAGRRSVRRALAVAGCGMITATLGACESTERESAKIGREEQQAAASQTKTTAKPATPGHGTHGGKSDRASKHQAGHPTGSGG